MHLFLLQKIHRPVPRNGLEVSERILHMRTKLKTHNLDVPFCKHYRTNLQEF